MIIQDLGPAIARHFQDVSPPSTDESGRSLDIGGMARTIKKHLADTPRLPHLDPPALKTVTTALANRFLAGRGPDAGRRAARKLLASLQSQGCLTLGGSPTITQRPVHGPTFHTALNVRLRNDVEKALTHAAENYQGLSEKDRAVFTLLWVIHTELLLCPKALARLLEQPIRTSLTQDWTGEDLLCIRADERHIASAYRLIHINPVTSHLLKQFPDSSLPWRARLGITAHPRSRLAARAWTLLRSFLIDHGVLGTRLPKRHKRFLRSMVDAVAVFWERVLAEYAGGGVEAYAADIAISYGSSDDYEAPEILENDPVRDESEMDIPDGIDIPDTDLDQALADVRSLVAGWSLNDRIPFEQLLDAGALATSPIARDCVEYFRALRRPTPTPASADLGSSGLETPASKALPTSLELRVMLEGLVMSFGNEQGHLHEICRFTDTYSDILSELPTAQSRARVGGFLVAFHKSREDYAPIRIDEIEGYPGRKLGVDTRLITERQYEEVLATLWHEAVGGDPVARGAVIVTILGYRLGLRPSETLRLRLACLERTGHMWITVRGTVKTDRARRRLPTRDFIPDPERTLLWQCCDAIERHGQGRDVLLLPHTPRNRNDIYVDRARKAFRDNLSDPTLRFYQLRHSFAARLMVEPLRALLTSTPPNYASAFLAPPSPESAVVAKIQHSGLWLRQVSRILGHGSPTITLRHYVHILDSLLAARIRKAGVYLSVKAFRSLFAWSDREARRRIPKVTPRAHRYNIFSVKYGE